MKSAQTPRRRATLSEPNSSTFPPLSPDRKVWAIRLLLLWFVIFVLLFLRRPDSLMNPQFWAEDGTVFFSQQLTLGSLKAPVHPYAGYLHTVPRIIALLASLFPAASAPLIFNAAALLISSLSCTAFAGPWCRNLLPSDALRITCCLITATGLEYGGELIGAVANIQWFLAIGAAALIFSDKGGLRAVRLELLLALGGLLIGLSAPETFVYAPFLVFQLITHRGLRRLLPLLMIAALCVQLCIAYATAEVMQSAHLTIGSIFLTTTAALISRSVVGSILGHSYLIHNADLSLLAIWTLALIIVSVWITALVGSTHALRRRVLLAAIYLQVAATFIPVVTRSFVGMFSSMYGLVHVTGDRYFLVSAALFVFLVAFSIDQRLAHKPEQLKVSLLLVIFLLGITNNFRVPRYKNMHWDAYAPAVEQWIEAHQTGKASPSLAVPINPQGWSLTLPATDSRLD